MRTLKNLSHLTILVFVVAACTEGSSQTIQPAEEIVQGGCETVFGGEICTWARIVGDDVVEVGADVPLSSIENAPADAEMVWPPATAARIEFPEAVTEQTGIDHLGINWEAHGHPPTTYMTPHFDFHLYTRSAAEIEAIDCSDENKPDVLPAGYAMYDEEVPGLGTLIGTCVPEMGMHALDEIQSGSPDPFEATMVVGYYSRDVIFVEPMVTKAKLMQAQSFSLDVPAVDGTGENWPSSFVAEYDQDARQYRFVFTI